MAPTTLRLTAPFRLLALSLVAVTFLAALALIAPTPASANGGAERYVATDGDNTDNNCLTEGSPCQTVGHALAQANSGDYINLAAGEYAEAADEENAFIISKDITIRGSSDGASILTPNGGGYRVMYIGGHTVTLESLIITGGSVGVSSGAGLRIFDGADVTLDRVSLVGNTSSTHVGAIWNNGSLLIVNSTISGNSANGVAAVLVNAGTGAPGTVVIRNSSIVGNTGDDALRLVAGTITLHNTLLAHDGTACFGAVTASASNVVTDGTCGSATVEADVASTLTATTVEVGEDTVTRWYTPQGGSPVVGHDEVTTGECPDIDQRGDDRVESCTVGSIEVAAPSTDATLGGLVITTATLSPTFASGITEYTASVPNSTTSVTVTPTSSDDGATITVQGDAVTSGDASEAIALDEGENTVTVVVMPEDEEAETETYTVTITRQAEEPSSDPDPTPRATPAPDFIEASGEVTVPVAQRERNTVVPGEDTTVELTTPGGIHVRTTVPADAAANPMDGDGGELDELILEVAAIDDMDAVQAQAPRPVGADIVADFVIRLTDGDGNLVSADFTEPVAIEFTVPDLQLPEGATSETLLVAYWDGEGWQMVEGMAVINEDGSATVTVQVSHFTLFSVFQLPQAGTFSSAIREQGVTYTIWRGGTLATLRAAITRDAGEDGALWIPDEGLWFRFAPGDSDVLNASFLGRFPTGLDLNSPVVVVP